MTTTFQSPLQTADYTKLRGAAGNNLWAGEQFITLCKNTLVFAARVNGAISSSSFAAIVFDTVTTGAYTDIEIGETFFLSHTSDIRAAYYRGRIRLDADSTHIYVNETSVNVNDDDYIFVVYDFDGWDKLSRMVGSTQYQDFDIAYHSLAPVAVGLQTAYANWNPDDSVYRIAFDLSNSYATDEHSSSALSFLTTLKAGTYTLFSGSLSTAVFTVDINANTEQWGKLVITDSQGVTTTRRFYIRAHGSTDTPSLDFGSVQITGSLDSGWNATVSAWNGVSSTLNQTFTVIWSQEYYNGVLGPLSIANNIDMVGRFHREENHGKGDQQYSYVTDVKFDIEGICTQMQRLQEQDLTTINISTATVWDEISFNTPQRSIVYYMAEHSTFLSLCDLTFPDGFDLTYLFQYFPNQGGNVLDAVKSIAAQINANIEFAPDGRIQVVRDTRFLTDKSGVTIVGNFDNRDFTILSDLNVDPVNKTGRLDAYGAGQISGNIIADRSRAPGNAQGYAAGQSTLDAQILPTGNVLSDAQAELNYRAGQQMAIENLTYAQDWQAATGGYHILIPSRGQRITHLYTDDTNVRGLSFDTSDYWQVVSITINHDNASGGRTVTTHEELEPPTGDSGDTVPQIAGGTQTNPILLQPGEPFPGLPDNPGNYLPDNPTPNPYPSNIPSRKGGTTIYSDGTIVDTSLNVTNNRTPSWKGAQPTLGGNVVKDITFDRTTITAPLGAYLLTYDGTNSSIWYTSDAFAIPTVWTQGATFTGEYDQIRSAGVAGSVLVYSTDNSATTMDFDFTASDGSWFVPPPPNVGQYTPGTGFTETCELSGVYREGATIEYSTSGTLIKFKATFTRVSGQGALSSCNDLLFYDGNVTNAFVCQASNLDGTFTLSWEGSQAVSTGLGVNVNVGNNAGGCPSPSGSVEITSASFTFASGNGGVRYSSDYGATVGSAIDLGSSPGGAGGFDLELTGTASLVAASGQVKIATTLGGSYSNAAGGTLSSGQPVTLVLPFRRWPHGAEQYAASDPDYLLMSSVQISSAAVWKVDGSSGTKTDITPTSGAVGIGPNLATVWQTSSVCYILCVVNVSGVFKLYRSLDAGATWSLSKTCTAPVYLRYKRFSPPVLYLLDGTSLYVSLNHGASWLTDTLPSSNTPVGMDAYF